MLRTTGRQNYSCAINRDSGLPRCENRLIRLLLHTQLVPKWGMPKTASATYAASRRPVPAYLLYHHRSRIAYTLKRNK